MLYVVVESVNAPGTPTDWVVLDGNGEMRERTPYFTNAVRFASVLTEQEREAQDAKLALDNTAGSREVAFIEQSFRQGQASAYRHAAMRLSFLMGGTLPRGGAAFRQQLNELKDKLDLWAADSKEQANRIQAKLDA